MTERLPQYDVFAVPVRSIYYDESRNCRGAFTLQSVEDLSKSIAELGRLTHPVWLQPAADAEGIPPGFDYRLLAGHRRYKAATVYLKWDTIPSMVIAGLSDRQARLYNFSENLERKDLNPLEEALAIRTLFPDGASVRAAAEELKRDTRWVHARLRLLRVPDEVQQMVAARRVTLLDLEIICKKTTPEEQIKAAQSLAASKRGRGRKTVFEGDALIRTFKRRRTKEEVNAKIEKMFAFGTPDIASRALAWAIGAISDEQIDEDIRQEYENRITVSDVIPVEQFLGSSGTDEPE